MTDRHLRQPIQLGQMMKDTAGRTPTIDTHYTECANAQSAFMVALQTWISGHKDDIKTRKDDHLKRTFEHEEAKKEYEREIQEYAAREVKMIEQVRGEREAVQEMDNMVQSLERQHATLKEDLARREEEIEDMKKKIILRRGVLSRDKEILDEYARRTAREAKALQDALGWTIEGVQQNVLLFRFTHIDPHDPEREFNIVLDVSNSTYRVTSSTPLLGTLPTLLEELNQTRQFYVFVRQLRKAFRQHVEEERRPGHAR